jgi:hypothetical protein
VQQSLTLTNPEGICGVTIFIVKYQIAGLGVMEATGNEINLLSGGQLLPCIDMCFIHLDSNPRKELQNFL